MENASKAIIMAGGILVTLIILALIVILFGQLSNVQREEIDLLKTEQIEEYNRKFQLYDRNLYGSELLSLINLIDDYENKMGISDILVSVNFGDSSIEYDSAIYFEGKMEKSEIKRMYDKLIGKNDDNSKDVIDELKMTAFERTNVEYNDYGRISYLEFESRQNDE